MTKAKSIAAGKARKASCEWKAIEFYGDSGGSLIVCEGDNGIAWNAPSCYMCGVAGNTPKLRAFLRRVLLRLEDEAGE